MKILRYFTNLFKKRPVMEINFPMNIKTKNMYYKGIKEKLGPSEAKRFNKIINKHLKEMEQHFNKEGEGWDLDYDLMQSLILQDFMGNYSDFLLNKIVLKKRKIKFDKPKFSRILISK